MRLFRVLPYDEFARARRPGHPLFVPPSSGTARIDNPDRYDVLYASDHPAGAVAEAFGWASVWDAGLLRPHPSLPHTVRALVSYDAPEDYRVCDLDDAVRLVELQLRPSQVVTRERAVTQGWAAHLFDNRQFAGVRWWSYYDPRWGSLGLWHVGGLRVADVTALSLQHPALIEAAHVLMRPLP